MRLRLMLACATIGATLACGSPAAPTPALNIAGQWTGTYTVGTCSETGAALGSGFCQSIGPGYVMTFTTAQPTGALSGTVGIGAFNIPVTGSLNGTSLTLTGSSPIVQNVQLTINTWQATVSGNRMTGSMAFTVIATVPPIGSATVSASTSLTGSGSVCISGQSVYAFWLCDDEGCLAAQANQGAKEKHTISQPSPVG